MFDFLICFQNPPPPPPEKIFLYLSFVVQSPDSLKNDHKNTILDQNKFS